MASETIMKLLSPLDNIVRLRQKIKAQPAPTKEETIHYESLIVGYSICAEIRALTIALKGK